eukprot:snap_masked-scaffold15_size728074-processed-gene-6.5 protein:Tk08872 transcript:snap_masked-scaffold15_size728074-processed-gene-6.5-mRNA-1 annotation:"opioid-binding protein cell adhesion molecule-like"
MMAHDPWIHAGKTGTVTLRCELCLSRQLLTAKAKRDDHDPIEADFHGGPEAWWMKDGKLLTRSTSRVRQMVHGQNHFLLRIKNLRDSDFGTYTCGHNASADFNGGIQTTTQPGQGLVAVTDSIEVSGVPYPAKFDLPTLWSDSIFKLTWRVNCSTPIINYQLEFREVPHGEWVTLNVPGDFGRSFRSRYYNRFAPSQIKVEEHVGTYTLKGLTSGTSYEARVRSRNEYGLSGQSTVISFHTFEIKEKKSKVYEPPRIAIEPDADDLESKPSNVIQATFGPPYNRQVEVRDRQAGNDARSQANSQPLATSTKEKEYAASFSSSSRMSSMVNFSLHSFKVTSVFGLLAMILLWR